MASVKMTGDVVWCLQDGLHYLWRPSPMRVDSEEAIRRQASSVHLRDFLRRHSTVGSALAEWPLLAVLCRNPIQGYYATWNKLLKAKPTKSRPKTTEPFDPDYLNELVVRLRLLGGG